jgi:isocitrate dehydrogenase (NAD+)
MTRDVTLIPGDGIGPEITEQTLRVVEAAGAKLNWDVQQAGMAAASAGGNPLPEATLESIRVRKVALKGPLTTPVGGGFRSINVELRRAFDLYANLRPAVTIQPGRYSGVDIVLVRENVEGFYSGAEHFISVADDPHAVGVTQGIVTRFGCERVIRYAFDYATRHSRQRVSIVHKANILRMTSGLFLEVGRAIAKEYEGKVVANEYIVDNCAMQLVLKPEQFDVIVTTNLFGDILSDEIAGLVGGLGLAPGGNIGAEVAIFEAVHGSAPDLAGRGIANPAAHMLAAALLLDHLGDLASARRVREAITVSIRDAGIKTRDLGGTATTREFGDAVVARLV